MADPTEAEAAARAGMNIHTFRRAKKMLRAMWSPRPRLIGGQPDIEPHVPPSSCLLTVEELEAPHPMDNPVFHDIVRGMLASRSRDPAVFRRRDD